ncbi:MAG TPA: tetratricopeptide repeat protein [Terracidiphilus sp.]|jgi:tetratricopeptide (TPR) repeat protein
MLRRLAIIALFWAAACTFAPAATEQWFQISSPHFTVITNSNDKQGRHVLDQFERMRWLFQTLFPKTNVDPALPIVVVAVRNQKNFQSFEPPAYLAKGQLNLAGFFLRTADENYVLVRLDAEDEHHPFSTIYHEYTHLQFSGAADWMPLWLNEGFAEFVQNTEIRNKDVLLGEPSVDDILYLRQNRLMPLSTLFKVDQSSPYYHEEQKGSVFYAESWALTHYLEVTDREKGTHLVPDYVSLVKQHQDPLVAAQTAFGDLKKLQSALEFYIGSGSYKQFILSSAAAPIDESSYQNKPLTQTQADAIRADFLVNVQRTQEARTLLDQVLKADPNNAQAHQTMGYLASRDGDYEAARKWYDEAVKLDSQSFLAHYYFATLSMRNGDSKDPAIESSLRAAIRLNPSFAPAYDQLAALFAMQHEKLDEAHLFNIRAIQLDPGNLVYRLNAAMVLMTMGRYDGAASVLRTAEQVLKSPHDSAILQNRLKEVEAIRSLGANPSNMVTAPPTGEVDAQTVKVVDVVPQPKHPTEPPNGSKHTATGVIRSVQCGYPAELEFQIDTGKKPVSVYSNNYFKIDLTALGFTPTGSLNPCKDFEGMKARVQYAETSDKTIDGQVIAVELRK